MRDRHHIIDRLVLGLESVAMTTASADARQRLAADAERDIAPLPVIAVAWVLMSVARHEGAHAWYAIKQGWSVPRTVLRTDGTGNTSIAGGGTDYETEIHRIVFALVGLAHDLRKPLSDVGLCFDLVSARLRVDGLNARGIGAHVSFQQVAALAVAFVDAHVVAIENIGLALYDARELDHYSVELFGGCGYEG
jgi:hypothetical protein